jgi:hypothetical protein
VGNFCMRFEVLTAVKMSMLVFCNAMWACWQMPTFRWNTLSPSSDLKRWHASFVLYGANNPEHHHLHSITGYKSDAFSVVFIFLYCVTLHRMTIKSESYSMDH